MTRTAMTWSLLAFFALASCESSAPARDVAPWPDHVPGPSPYTAEQIRDAHPDGTVLRFRMWTQATGDVVQQMEFVGGDAEGTTVRQSYEKDGVAAGNPTEQRATWTTLRDHAVFDAATTEREVGRVTVPAGTFDCWIFSVRRVATPGVVQRLWFALDKPGPPVLVVSEDDGDEVMRMELLEYRRGA